MQGKKRVDIVVNDEGARGNPIGVIYGDGTIEEIAIARARRRRERRAAVSFVMMEETAATVAPSALTPSQVRILNYLLSVYQEENQMSVMSQADLSRDLRLEKSNLRRALKDLIDRKFLYKIGPQAWMVTPHYGFRGKTTLWRQLLDRYPEPDWNL